MNILIHMYFSIVCPAYNVENYISECINSVIKQSFCDWEMIIVNDESSDNTCEIIHSFLKDKRISLFSIPHSGQTIARNFGINKAVGDYILFLDSDDCLNKNTLQFLHDNIAYYSSDILSFGMKYFNSVNEFDNQDEIDFKVEVFSKDNILKHYYGDNKTMSLCGNAIKRELVVEGFKTIPESLRTIRLCEDFVALFEIIKLCSSSAVLNVPLYYYRINPNSVSHTKLPGDRADLTAAYEHVYRGYFEIETSDNSIINKTKVFLSYLPITLVINEHVHKYRTFLKARRMFLFKRFSLNNKWESCLLKILVFAMKRRLYVLFLVSNFIYLKKYSNKK